MPNRLIDETSPYLVAHAHNPVDWFPWGSEALDLAVKDDKPILLSIGYNACHWCHVMERESFEDPQIAALMNERFVCIKVDREERPDIDAIYMDAVQAMTGHGGWPMTMFLAPDQTPFYGGTYFPPDRRHGLPSFREVLLAVSDAWETRRPQVMKQGAELVERIRELSTLAPSNEPLTNSLLTHAVAHAAGVFDPVSGGFGGAPKFPQAPFLEFMTLAAARGLGDAHHMLEHTLEQMARGGIYDQLAGGFARYSVDAEWTVPHFEKMLYDNAQLIRVYARSWQLMKKPLLKRIATETTEYLLRDMRSAEGGFYASEDADSEGEEGKFYAWSWDELNEVFPDAIDQYGATKEGNFDGLNVLTARGDEVDSGARARLLEERNKRTRPSRDEKILTSWNGLAISALAEAGAAFGRVDFIEAAARCAGLILSLSPDRLHRSFLAKLGDAPATLEDYAYLVDGLMTLWEATFEPRWFEEAKRLNALTQDLFWDSRESGFFTTARDSETLLYRPKEVGDSATPSPAAVASLNALRLRVIGGDGGLMEIAEQHLRLAHTFMARAPQACGSSLVLLDFFLHGATEVVVVGEPDAMSPLRAQAWANFVPNRTMAGTRSPDAPSVESPLLEGRTNMGAAAFVCRNHVCGMPARNPEELRAQLIATLKA